MPSRVFNVSERPFSEIRGVAVAITRVDDDQRHVGILHKEGATGEVRLLHLAWHLTLRNNTPKPCYAWVDPSIHPARALQVAARCRQIYRANERGIPYAFSAPNDCFDRERGIYLFGPTRHGLTCASFVLAVFDLSGLPLIRYETWPNSRQDDEVWKRRIIASIKDDPNGTPEHIKAIESELQATRYRPEDVAGAAAGENIPASFEDAARMGQKILDKLAAEGLCIT